jgi:hypothetical protein
MVRDESLLLLLDERRTTACTLNSFLYRRR